VPLTTHRFVEAVLALAAVVLVALGCFIVLRPFLSGLMWAVVLAYASWPLYSRLENRLGRRRTLSATLMTFAVATVLVLPFVAVALSLGDNVTTSITALKEWSARGLPAPPEWLASLPLIGDPILSYWNSLVVSVNSVDDLKDLLNPLREGALAFGVSLGRGTLELALSVFIAFFIFRRGDELAVGLDAALTRLIGPRAPQFIAVTGATITSVVYGIIGTALIQGILGGLGYAATRVPGALFLGLLTFFVALIPFGPPLIWVPAVGWLVSQERYVAAGFMALWGFFVISGIDNIIKPYLISRGTQLPFVLVFLGVIGGVLAFGFIGVFLGPVLLALGHTLLEAWARGEALHEPHEPPPD
jgi:predicted PurR-regulated permease PerM